MVTPIIAGKSFVNIDKTLNCPNPGQSKIDSTRKVPPSISPNVNPAIVETGINVFLYAEHRMVSTLLNP